MKTLVITRTLPKNLEMEINQHRAKTYGEWCEHEVKRIGGDAKIVFEYRKYVDDKLQIVDKTHKKAQIWCRVEREVD